MTNDALCTDRLSAPTECPYCHAAVIYTTNDALYGKQYGSWPYIYLCTNAACRASVGVHPGTTNPLGTMADKATRRARKMAHAAFDPLWRSGSLSRTRAYAWLADALGISLNQCHISMMDVSVCEHVISLCIMAQQQFVNEGRWYAPNRARTGESAALES